MKTETTPHSLADVASSREAKKPGTAPLGSGLEARGVHAWFGAKHALKDVTYPPPVFDEEGVPTNFVFEPGKPDQYSVVRASLHHQFITPFMDQIFHMGPDLPAIVNAYVIVKNEPWI